MRKHGDANQVDPSIDSNKVIHIPWNPAVPGGFNGTNKGGQGNSGPGQFCRGYLDAAQAALQEGRTPQRPSTSALVKFSECMRANGIPDFPDPSGKGLVISVGGDLDPHNSTFQIASKLCAGKTGVPGFGGTPQPGTIELGSGP